MTAAEPSPTFNDLDAAGGGRIAELSRSAVRYGERLVVLPEALLAARIYSFGGRPLAARLRRQFPDAAAVAAFVESSCGPVLRRDWHELPGTPHWRRWAAVGTSGRVAGKLYVSVVPEALPEAVAMVAALARASSIAAFKVGADAAGICRPDRLVVYVSAFEDLPALGALLRGRLAGCPADGVPFTAAVTPDGMLSWAVDRPEGASWRQWLTARLARHLHAAVDAGAPDPGCVALDCLRLDGVDPVQWTPVAI
ncbi:hypothetical protein [Kribbella speibonae]|uniref:Uncharacterized protein n=1 Tax=Kribbella speibonae TaxID=1572660 RepID=A0A4R0IEB2_9ACTN|nr:hypothetical protein [Kribbella speibonae]TCC30827.1 hypothetical protein E0H92_37590 [Kribbella speibonae]